MSEPIGSVIGRLGDPPGPDLLDHHRLAFVDRLVQAGADSPTAAWVDAWRRTAGEIHAEVRQEIARGIEAAAAESRFPTKQLPARMPTDVVKESLANRLAAAGIPIEKLPPASSLSARAAAASATWDGAREIVRRELRLWREAADRIAAWQRPWWPLVTVLAGLWILALIPALWTGGLIPAPGWWTAVSEWFWSLPWP